MGNFVRKNFKIRVPEVRVIDQNGSMLGVMPTRVAQKKAMDAGLDLVEISPNAKPPVCKIMDYGKYMYDESIKAKEARKAQKVAKTKEVQFHVGTDSGDIEHKLKQIREFLADGSRVRLSLKYRGREAANKQFGFTKIEEVLKLIGDDCIVEQRPRLEGRLLLCQIAPKRK